MESITIDMESAAYLDIASAVLPTTRCLSICITGYASGDPSGLPAVNRILNKARGSEVLKLKLADKRLRVGPESITCAALTHLEISAPTSVDTMLAVIKTLPNLVKLTLYDLDMSDIQVDISIPDADQDAAMEPLHSSLQSLKIGSGRNRLVRESAAAVALVAVLKCMLLRIPTLTRVHSREIPKEPVLDFVRAHELRYPRLRSLVLDRRSV
ncbi:hypothetical protein H4R21_004836 [Coemansia helicoidea]|uniref:Uncharacterized protein n=1 Tax=Coemansia helicoidea TaxID=1286919 RepID=A0ACC1KW79_9FUNG|nr:hypothetical protein H4R21_004836 [Coemansia helicoidea]